jgi:Flp pilus assembly CpaE family ATPase
VWERCDEVLYVTDQSMLVARTVPRFMEFFVRLGLRGVEPRLILNKFETQNPFTVEELIRIVGTPIYAKIPRDNRTFERLQLRPQDLWRVAPASALARSVETLARKLGTRRELVPESAGGLVARFLGALSARV